MYYALIDFELICQTTQYPKESKTRLSGVNWRTTMSVLTMICSNIWHVCDMNFSCFEGWSGPSCDQCLPLAGCQHGKCVDHPNTCVCDDGWEGHLCDKPFCKYVFTLYLLSFR